ncbi:hypothetical protein NVP1121O_073 [Vibrio phage 1.121.O._10N.286.46.C4]|nr:hypothetical protein NVP1121O_073 [Vibrio phage 1.121.O._10N.286.46.C4]
MISDQDFKDIYLSGEYKDPHSEFARREGISRNEAKSRAHFRLYSNPLDITKTTITIDEAESRVNDINAFLKKSSEMITLQRQTGVGIDMEKVEQYVAGAAAGKGLTL